MPQNRRTEDHWQNRRYGGLYWVRNSYVISSTKINNSSPVDKCSVTFKKKKSKALASYFAESGTACVEFVEEGNTHLAISSALPGEYVLISALQPMLGRYY